ncbi:MAG: CPBP family intramembrane metalloprotease [Clostridia bacterium]|nr:CPBP family intramembrane metalloprotease [Clostridia bacterium]
MADAPFQQAADQTDTATKEKRPRKPKRDRIIQLTPSVLVLATYFLLLASKIIDVTLLTRDNQYFSVILLQMMIFLLPGAVWCIFSGDRYMKGLRLAPPKRLSSIPLILSAALMLMSGSLLLSLLFGGMDSLAGSFSLYEDTFIAKSTGTVSNKIYLVLAYAVLPALCEEFVYRGILCFEYERGGVPKAVLLSSLFFTILHFSLQNLPVYLFSGMILALTMYACRSVWGAVIAHFLYNLFGLFGQPYMNTLYRITGSKTLFLILVTVCFLGAAAIFCSMAARLYRQYLYAAMSADYRKPVHAGPAELFRAVLQVAKEPTTIACFAVYVLALLISVF